MRECKLDQLEAYKKGTPAVVARGLKKTFGEVKALEGVDLQVSAGTIMGMLGPNGSGKTTFVRIMTTLLKQDEGEASVAGYDVIKDADIVRGLIGLAGQYPAVDEILTGKENLQMVGQLYHLGRKQARYRADELLEQFDLTRAANRKVKTYSGGMRRRLDLAASIVSNPPILFLDEPTTGLDPRSRLALWDVISNLVTEGTTVLLTTQYLEEADHLANIIAVLDSGKIIRQGTAEDLKTCCGGDALLQLKIENRDKIEVAEAVLKPFGDGRLQIDMDTGYISLPISEGTSILPEIMRQLDSSGITVADLAIRQPTLDDVFLALTGRTIDISDTDTDMEATEIESGGN